MEALREFFVSLGLEADEAKWAKTLATVKGLEVGLERVVDAVKMVASEMVKVVTDTAGYADHLDDVSQRTGIGTDALQTLGYAAGLTGASMESVQTGVQHLARVMAEAAGGSKAAKEALAKLGIQATDAAGRLRNPEDAMYDAAEGAARLTNDTERTAAVLDVLGKGATDLIPMLRGGSAGINAAADEMRQLGGVMGEDAVKASAAFADNLDRLHVFVDGLKRQVGALLIEALGPSVEAMIAWAKANRAAIGVKLTEFVNNLTKAARFLFAVLKPMADVVSVLVKAWRLLTVVMGGEFAAKLAIGTAAILWLAAALSAAAVKAFTFAAASAAAAVSSAAAWVAAAWPIIAVAAALAAVVLAVDDVAVTLRGGDSLLNRYGARFSKFIDEWVRPNTEDMWVVRQLKWAISLLTDLEGRLMPWLQGKLKGTIFELPSRQFEGVNYGPDPAVMDARARAQFGAFYTPKSSGNQSVSTNVVNNNTITVNAQSNDPGAIANSTAAAVSSTNERNYSSMADTAEYGGISR